MNQINFENRFNEKLDAVLDTKQAAIFGDAYEALKTMPVADQEDSATIYYDADNDVLKISSSGT